MLLVQRKLCLTLLSLLLTFLGSQTLYAETIRLKVCYEDKEQFPYYMGDTPEVLSQPGVSVDLLRLAVKDLDMHVEFRRAPWSRCLNFMKKGMVDAVFNASYKKDRLKMGLYPTKDGVLDPNRRLTTLSYAIYTLKGTKTGWNGEKFIDAPGAIGAPAGYSIIAKLKANNVQIQEAVSTYEGFHMLTKQRVIGFAAQTVTGDSLIRKHYEFRRIVKTKPYLVTKPYYMMVSRQFYERYPDLAEQIWDSLATARDEHLEELLLKY